MSRTLLLASTLAARVIFAAPAHAAGWIICNKTTSVAYAAIAWVNPNFGDYHIKGWWSMPACGCTTIWGGTLPQDSDRPENAGVFYFAESSEGYYWGNGPQFCVEEGERFEMYANERCSTKRPFTFLSFPRNQTYTLSLTGGTTSCPTPIDQ